MKIPLSIDPNGITGSGSKTYKTWQAMKTRCSNPRCDSYKYYGQKGIKVCRSWESSFHDFVADMGWRPDGKTLDRLDTAKGYQKNNCKWSTPTEQMRNRPSYNVLNRERAESIVTLRESGMTMRAIAKQMNVSVSTVFGVLRKGKWLCQ